MTKCAWFTRAWVIQEVGLATNPRVLYGDVEFGYRDLCAFYLETRAFMSFYNVHMEWMDWSQKAGSKVKMLPQTFLALFDDARRHECMDPRDHVYAFLGHPLARLEGDGGTIIKPDYAKGFRDVYLELAIQLLKQEKPLHLLSTTEHDKQSLEADSPSWVPDWNLGQTRSQWGPTPTSTIMLLLALKFALRFFE